MKTTIIYKKSNILIKKLENLNIVKSLKCNNLFKIFFLKSKFSDVYFHSGILDKKSIKNIYNSKITIVDSYSKKNLILDNLNINEEKIKVIYPCIDISKDDILINKEEFFKNFDIDLNSKIIFFTAKNIQLSGIKEFLEICSSLKYENFKIIIAYNKNQATILKFLLNKYKKLKSKIILLENYKNINELFVLSDIFLLPTYNKSFSLDVIKAMYYKCAVFVSIENDSKEIIDVFSSMQSPTDKATSFKIDAILNDEKELSLIKEQNHLLSKEFSLSNNLKIFNNLILNMH